MEAGGKQTNEGLGKPNLMGPSSPQTHLLLKEEDVIKLACEFLQNRDMHISQVTLERESGVINGNYSDDLLFLRQLILDGQWDDILEFIQPLQALPSFDQNRFHYQILKAKLIELVCIKSETPVHQDGTTSVNSQTVDSVVETLKEIEAVSPSKEHYSALCLLLTLNKLSDHPEYRNWNPSKGRINCFREVLPLVEDLLGGNSMGDKKSPSSDLQDGLVATKDRLMQLIIKGILYESCVDFCQQKATGGPPKTTSMNGSHTSSIQSIKFTNVLSPSDFSDSDLSLLSWLQALPSDTFACPFEQRSLNVDVERIKAPHLETSWTEHMLITPIKPNTFPHSAMPANIRGEYPNKDIMTKSLNVGLKPGALSDSTNRLSKEKQLPGSKPTLSPSGAENGMLSKSLASFHLSPAGNGIGENEAQHNGGKGVESRQKILMDQSVDQLFKEGEAAAAQLINPVEDSSQGAKDAITTSTSSSNQSPYNNKMKPDSIAVRQSSRNQQISPPFETSAAQMQNNSGLPHSQQPNYDEDPYEFRDKSGMPSQQPNSNVTIGGPPRFLPVSTLEDIQAIRCAEFHPGGKLFAVGSNSKTLRICAYPSDILAGTLNKGNKADAINNALSGGPPTVLFKRTKHHKGSIYCLSWSPRGDLLATGSNDKTVKLMRFQAEGDGLGCTLEGPGAETELAIHDGTVRDCLFMEDSFSTVGSASGKVLIVTAGAGDCRIHVTDCATANIVQSMAGHTGHVLSLCQVSGNGGSPSSVFVSGSGDKTVRFWDLRARGCVNVVQYGGFAPPVASCSIDPSGRLLATGHEASPEGGACTLYDIRGGRIVQSFRPHSADIRSVKFSPNAYYLLTAGYDNRLVLTDLQGDLTAPLPSVVVAQHSDKVISGRWHPSDFSFVSTSADKTATLWALPPL